MDKKRIGMTHVPEYWKDLPDFPIEIGEYYLTGEGNLALFYQRKFDEFADGSPRVTLYYLNITEVFRQWRGSSSCINALVTHTLTLEQSNGFHYPYFKCSAIIKQWYDRWLGKNYKDLYFNYLTNERKRERELLSIFLSNRFETTAAA